MDRQVGGSGIGLSGLLFVIFMVLKLTDLVDWSWWWVTAPLWIPVALGLVLGLVTWAFKHVYYGGKRRR